MALCRSAAGRFRGLVGIALLGLSAACGSSQPSGGDLEALAASAQSEASTHREILDSVVDRLALRAAARGDHTLDLLFLTAGGQNGAYGIGFLRGWQARHGDAMPRFDLVSGVSTGALQAPFAFLGTHSSLERAAELYRQAAERIAPKFDWLFWLRRNGGIVDARRFRRELRQVYDPSLLASVSSGFREHRQILLSTSDLDLGIGRIWDVERVLRGTGGENRLQDVLLAATAIPGIFPPVIIDGHAHMDGGVISNVLPVLDLDDYRALAARLRAAGVTRPVTVRVWVVMNLWTHPKMERVERASRSALAARGTSMLFASHQPQMLELLAERARTVSRDVAGLRMEMRATAIPAELASAPEADKLFDGGWMRRLEEIGYNRARGDSPWDVVPSAYERPQLAATGH